MSKANYCWKKSFGQSSKCSWCNVIKLNLMIINQIKVIYQNFR